MEDDTTKALILQRLRAIEERHAVKVLYACESGSRAWGFPSADSDFDVRFLYIHPLSWYLSIHPGRDVIEEPLVDALDISGWDLRKALGLLHKSNPPLLEWLHSPIVYLEQTDVAHTLKKLLPQVYSPSKCFSHYLHMAMGNFRAYLKGETVRTKKYFYVLRPVLAMQWLEQGLGVVPTDFRILVDRLITDPVLLGDIQTLMAEKMAGTELREGPRIESISSFIEAEMERLSQKERVREDPYPISALDEIFQTALHTCWS